MVCNHGTGCNDGASREPPEDDSVLGEVDRRGFLKRASGAGAGFGLLKSQLDQATKKGDVLFGTIGIRYRIEDDVEPEFVDDCAPPKWREIDGELVFYSQYLNDAERNRLAGGQNLVAGTHVRDLPAGRVSLAQGSYLPTGLGKQLQGRRGVLYDDYSLPTPQVVTAGKDISVEFDGVRQRVAPGEERVVELDTATVGIRQYEKQVTDDGTTAGEENDQNVTYESKVVETTLAPEVQIRNYGEMPFYTVDDQMEVN